MKKGFTYGVATKLIYENPGMTSIEVAEVALQRGLCNSDSKTPVQSLASTLAKEVREGRNTEVKAVKVDGILRYYPASHNLSSAHTSNIMTSVTPLDETVSIRIPREHGEIADLLVEAGRSKSRSEALAWLISEAIKGKSSQIKQVREAVDRIRNIKQSISI